MTTVLAWIGGIVVAALILAGLFYAGAYVNWVWFWRYGKGKRSLPK